MLIAQITDLHIGFEPDNPDEPNWQRLNATLEQIIDGPNRPDLLVVSGDLADHGDLDSYRRCAEALAACPFPVYPCLGNHDDRTNFASVFPAIPFSGGFAQYCVELEGLRLIMLDTHEPGRHGGGFCEDRARWLRERLAEDQATPTVLVMHHPPLDIGIAWMATRNDEPWVRRLIAAIEGHAQVKAIWTGHFHRPIAVGWHGATLTVCPATAAQLALDTRPIDPETPDDRSMIIDDAAGYALHRWQDGTLVTLFDTVDPARVTLAKYDVKMQGLVQHLAEERRF